MTAGFCVFPRQKMLAKEAQSTPHRKHDVNAPNGGLFFSIAKKERRKTAEPLSPIVKCEIAMPSTHASSLYMQVSCFMDAIANCEGPYSAAWNGRRKGKRSGKIMRFISKPPWPWPVEQHLRVLWLQQPVEHRTEGFNRPFEIYTIFSLICSSSALVSNCVSRRLSAPQAGFFVSREKKVVGQAQTSL